MKLRASTDPSATYMSVFMTATSVGWQKWRRSLPGSNRLPSISDSESASAANFNTYAHQRNTSPVLFSIFLVLEWEISAKTSARNRVSSEQWANISTSTRLQQTDLMKRNVSQPDIIVAVNWQTARHKQPAIISTTPSASDVQQSSNIHSFHYQPATQLKFHQLKSQFIGCAVEQIQY